MFTGNAALKKAQEEYDNKLPEDGNYKITPGEDAEPTPEETADKLANNQFNYLMELLKNTLAKAESLKAEVADTYYDYERAWRSKKSFKERKFVKDEPVIAERDNGEKIIVFFECYSNDKLIQVYTTAFQSIIDNYTPRMFFPAHRITPLISDEYLITLGKERGLLYK